MYVPAEYDNLPFVLAMALVQSTFYLFMEIWRCACHRMKELSDGLKHLRVKNEMKVELYSRFSCVRDIYYILLFNRRT